MVAGTYAGFPQSHVSPSVIRYLFQQCYGAPEMPDGSSLEVLARRTAASVFLLAAAALPVSSVSFCWPTGTTAPGSKRLALQQYGWYSVLPQETCFVSYQVRGRSQRSLLQTWGHY